MHQAVFDLCLRSQSLIVQPYFCVPKIEMHASEMRQRSLQRLSAFTCMWGVIRWISRSTACLGSLLCNVGCCCAAEVIYCEYGRYVSGLSSLATSLRLLISSFMKPIRTTQQMLAAEGDCQRSTLHNHASKGVAKLSILLDF